MATVVENMTRAKEDLLSIKNAVIATGVELPGGTPSSLYADKVAEVYEKGKSEGSGDTEAAYNQGKADEQREFWEVYQDGGARRDYTNAFAGIYWTDSIYNPIYPIILDKSISYGGSYITDTIVPITITENVTSIDVMWAYNNRIRVIRELTVHENLAYGRTFNICTALEHLIVKGIIGQNGFNVLWSTLLDKVSIQSIINCLSDTTANLTVTLSLTAVNNAFETSKGASDGSTSAEWLELIENKSNWTISLA